MSTSILEPQCERGLLAFSSLTNPRKETPCHIEPSSPLLRLPSSAWPVSPLTPWHGEAVSTAPAVFASGASTAEVFTAELTCAARAHGISGRELHRAFGDIDDYLTEQYSRVCVAP